MSDDRSTFEITAENWGREAGSNAAEWAIVPDRMSKEDMLRMIAGIEAGDPKVMDAFNVPNLSGEYADGEDEETLADKLGIKDEDELQVSCDAWENGSTAAFWEKVGDVLRYHTQEEQ